MVLEDKRMNEGIIRILLIVLVTLDLLLDKALKEQGHDE